MEIRDSATRKKYLEAKKFIKEYEEEYAKSLRIEDFGIYLLYGIREEIQSIRERSKRHLPILDSHAEMRILTRKQRIKEFLKERYNDKQRVL